MTGVFPSICFDWVTLNGPFMGKKTDKQNNPPKMLAELYSWQCEEGSKAALSPSCKDSKRNITVY